MIYLIAASILWSLSFSLIKKYLTDLDSNLVAFIRLFISFLVFLPFFRPKTVSVRTNLKLMAIGAVEYGIMYMAYIFAFKFLKAYEVAMFTVFTPIYVVVIHDLKKRKIDKFNMLAAMLAVLGAVVAVYSSFTTSDRVLKNIIGGFFILQIANISFAFGQIEYRAFMKKKTVGDLPVFAALFLGATLVTLPFAAITADFSAVSISMKQLLVLLWLGVVPSGLGFYLWNKGARKTKAGYLAVLNDLKIPLGILFSILFLSEQPNIPRLIISLAFMFGALFIAERS
ncbi:MAG: EamA family transporter [Kiritimatiellae bacterium]|jgi:drug/metabolite transporter (DMT)-like permease|nr:EamA family transporter [Kiritimatiellia bacterium]